MKLHFSCEIFLVAALNINISVKNSKASQVTIMFLISLAANGVAVFLHAVPPVRPPVPAREPRVLQHLTDPLQV